MAKKQDADQQKDKKNKEKQNDNDEKKVDEVVDGASKKRKLVLLAGIGGISALSLGGAGVFVYKTISSKSPSNASSVEAHKDENVDGKKEELKNKDEKETNKDKENSKDKTAKEKDAVKEDGTAQKDKESHSSESEKKPAETDAHDDKTNAHDDKAAEKTDLKDGKKNSGDKQSKVPSFGETFSLNRFDVNLGNPIENRFLRLSIALEYRSGQDQLDELKKREPQIRDIIISSVATRNRTDLLTDVGRNKLRREILNKLNEVTEKPIQSVYFTEFVVE